jgi:hypothetical protein
VADVSFLTQVLSCVLLTVTAPVCRSSVGPTSIKRRETGQQEKQPLEQNRNRVRITAVERKNEEFREYLIGARFYSKRKTTIGSTCVARRAGR